MLFGNAYEFLWALTDESYEPTFSFSLDDGQVCTTGFAHGEMVLCARSPHITMGNLYLAQNAHCYDLLRYFNLTPNIICVNAIESNIQQRLNGCDYDSDSMLVTDDELIIAGVTGCYDILKVPVCKAEPVGNTDYENTPKSLAALDQTIAKNKIGEIVNLSQFLNCLLWDGLFSEEQASIVRWIFITTSAFSLCCREWRSTRQSACTPSIPARCSPACAITARITRKITVGICLPSTNISWAMKAPIQARTTLTLKHLWLSFTMRRMPLPAEQPTQGHFPCPSCSILIPRTQVRTIRTKKAKYHKSGQGRAHKDHGDADGYEKCLG